MSVKNYTDSQLLERVKSLDTFKHIPINRWILGVRSNEDSENKFDDKFYEFEGEKFLRVLSGTTNPGATILRGGFKKYSKHGAAVLKSDFWYYDLWKYGLHNNKMPALLQLGCPVFVYRDKNMNGKSEEIGEPQKGWFGINFHANTYDFSKGNIKIKSEDIGSWSAGCQVANDRDKYIQMMKYYRLASKNGVQTHVSYCLINEF